jgi:hypothetical protein
LLVYFFSGFGSFLTRLFYLLNLWKQPFNGSAQPLDGGCLVLIVDRFSFFLHSILIFGLVSFDLSVLSILVDSVVFDESFFWHRRK